MAVALMSAHPSSLSALYLLHDRGDVFQAQPLTEELLVVDSMLGREGGGCGYCVGAHVPVDGSPLMYIWATPTGLRGDQKEENNKQNALEVGRRIC